MSSNRLIVTRGFAWNLYAAADDARPATTMVVSPGLPELDGCPILGRLGAFVVDQGVCTTLEHVVRDRLGRPVDLTQYDLPVRDTAGSSSSSGSTPAAEAGNLVLRIRDWLGYGYTGALGVDVRGYATDPANGVVRAELPARVVEQAGVYELSWGVLSPDDQPVRVSTSLMSVERTAWAKWETTRAKNLGPPGLQDIRMRLMDSGRAENFLLDDVEFGDEQILQALWKPVQHWNEVPPPLRRRYDTRTFPYRGHWLDATLGQLHLTAATHYRRNRLAHSAGGVTIDDTNKEKEYMAEGMRLWTEYTDWVFMKKVEINADGFYGSERSEYSAGSGW